MHVRLLLAVRRRGRVDRPLIGVAVAYLLAYKLAHQRGPLIGVQLTRKGNLHFAVGGAVLALEGVRRLPERLRVDCAQAGMLPASVASNFSPRSRRSAYWPSRAM